MGISLETWQEVNPQPLGSGKGNDFRQQKKLHFVQHFLRAHASLPGMEISLCAQQTHLLFDNTLPITRIT